MIKFAINQNITLKDVLMLGWFFEEKVQLKDLYSISEGDDFIA